MSNVLIGIRLATNEVKAFLVQKKVESNISNDVMCIILKDILSEFEQAAAYDYARVIAQTEADRELAEKQKEAEAKED